MPSGQYRSAMNVGGYGDKMFSALANHSSVAKRILAELALDERLSSFVLAIVVILQVSALILYVIWSSDLYRNKLCMKCVAMPSSKNLKK